MVQHVAITDPQIHEPKGVAAASANYVYVSDGAGSGSWRKVDSSILKSLAGDAGSTNSKLITDGTNGFVLKTDAVYGSMVITGNTNNFAITAAADTTLATASQYFLFTGTGAPWASENLFGGTTFLTDRITVPVNGIYQLNAWSNITGFPSNTAKLAIRYRVSGGAFSSRYPMTKSNAVGDVGNLDGFGLIALNANDYLQIYIGSDTTGNVVVQHMNTMLKLIRQT